MPSVGISQTGGSGPTEQSQIEQLSIFASDLYQRATTILNGLRDMRTSAFGPQPEAVDSGTKANPAGAVDLLRAQLQEVSDALTACESVLREVRRII